MVLGTQWYILFNVIAGASTMPKELRDAADNFGVKGWLWWKTRRAARGLSLLRHRRHHRLGRRLERLRRGGSGQLGQHHPACPWPGRLYRRRRNLGRFPPCRAGHGGDGFFVVVVNRIFWQPLYWQAERKYRLN